MEFWEYAALLYALFCLSMMLVTRTQGRRRERALARGMEKCLKPI